MTRAERIRDLTSDKAYVLHGVAYVSPDTMRRIASEMLHRGVASLPPGVTIETSNCVPTPHRLNRAKKIVRRIHRARLKNRGKPWV